MHLISRQLFGEGLNWAGCTLVYLLGQQRRYELMDFTYHMVRVHRVDQKSETLKGVVSSETDNRQFNTELKLKRRSRFSREW